MRKLFVICLVFGASAVFIMALPGGAQETSASKSALAVSPAILEEVLEPGKATPFTLHVNNVTNFPLPVKAMVRNFVAQSAELEKTERARLDASQWFTLSEPDFILQPNQTRTVKGIIKPPADAVPGGHYATVYFQPLIPQEALSPSTAFMNSQVGVLSFLIVKGDVEQTATYATPLTSPGLVQQGPVDFTFAIRNTGNVHIMPTGKLTVRDGAGKEVGQIDLPASMILPDATKEYSLAWDAPGKIGKFSAELQVNYGNNTNLGNITVTVWIVPWAAIIMVMLCSASLLLLVVKTRHRWRKAWRVLRSKDMRFGS